MLVLDVNFLVCGSFKGLWSIEADGRWRTIWSCWSKHLTTVQPNGGHATRGSTRWHNNSCPSAGHALYSSSHLALHSLFLSLCCAMCLIRISCSCPYVVPCAPFLFVPYTFPPRALVLIAGSIPRHTALCCVDFIQTQCWSLLFWNIPILCCTLISVHSYPVPSRWLCGLLVLCLPVFWVNFFIAPFPGWW